MRWERNNACRAAWGPGGAGRRTPAGAAGSCPAPRWCPAGSYRAPRYPGAPWAGGGRPGPPALPRPPPPHSPPAPGTPRPREGGAGSRRRALQDEFRKKTDTDRRGSLGLMGRLVLGVGGPGDVEVHPREAVDEFPQEPAARDRASATPPGVLHVRNVRFQELPVLVPQRQRPAAFSRPLSCLAYLGEQRVVVSHLADRHVPKRDDDCPRERRGVDHRRRLEAPRVRQRVAQDEPPLGIGVDDLDGLAEMALDDVARLNRRPGRQGLGGPGVAAHA